MMNIKRLHEDSHSMFPKFNRIFVINSSYPPFIYAKI